MRDYPGMTAPVSFVQEAGNATTFYNISHVSTVDFRPTVNPKLMSTPGGRIMNEIMQEIDQKEMVLGDDGEPVALPLHYAAYQHYEPEEAFDVDINC